MSDLSLPLPADFNRESTLRYLDRSPLELLHRVDGETVSRLIEIEGAEPILCRMILTDDQVLIECLNRSPKEAEKTQIVQYLELWWDLKRDLSPFYALAEADPLLRQTLPGNRGLRMMG
ncbi:MAG: DNA glycosylase, partial [Bacteroidota bacterium]